MAKFEDGEEEGPEFTEGFNPATRTLEARCECGVMVATMTEAAMVEARQPAVAWLALVWNGAIGHREAGCGD